jgi:hypothetical protein
VRSWAWWLTPVSLAFWRPKQEDCELEASWGYVSKSCVKTETDTKSGRKERMSVMMRNHRNEDQTIHTTGDQGQRQPIALSSSILDAIIIYKQQKFITHSFGNKKFKNQDTNRSGV